MRVEAAHEMGLGLTRPRLPEGEVSPAPLLARLQGLRDAKRSRGRAREEQPGGEGAVGRGRRGEEARRERGRRRWRRSLRRVEGRKRGEGKGRRRSLGGREGWESRRVERRSEVSTAAFPVLVRGLRCS